MNSATYSPEDNKLRLYVGRVPRDEYLALRAEGWTSTPKQNCDFVATWTPQRRNTALKYADIIEDEDMGPAERAADRAERFGEYRDKRTDEATGHANRYDSGPSAHGYQSAARAERSAARHDRIADRACDSWSKAEYWQRRTAGVISHALYKSTPGVRMGRIKTLESELRKLRASMGEYVKVWEAFKKLEAITDPAEQTKAALLYTGHCSGLYCSYLHPRPELVSDYYKNNDCSLYSLLDNEAAPITGAEACAFFFSDHSEPSEETDWTKHLELRLAYENQMLEAAGGRAAFVEMEVGGWIGGFQIRKVNKSSATGRVVSVNVLHPKGWSGFTRESGYKEHVTRPAVVTLNIERLSVNSYRAPTSEDVAKLESEIASEKSKAPKKAPCPLINPTDEDAERLQALWNERAKAAYGESVRKQYVSESIVADSLAKWKPSTVCRINQATYSANSKGAYARAATKNICGNGVIEPGQSFHSYKEQRRADAERGPAVCQLRATGSDGEEWHGAKRVIVLTDKPQKPFPAAVWEPHKPILDALVEASELLA